MEKPISYQLLNPILKLLSPTFVMKRSNPACILCYHSISSDNWDYSVDTKTFEEQIKLLVSKYEIVTLSGLLKSKKKKGKVAITFDDGYENVLKSAFPILKKYNIEATVFIVGDRDRVNRKQLGTSEKLLSMSQILSLKKAGWEIGFHTETHRDLVTLTKSQLESEIVEGKKKLEKQLGTKIKYLAYPHGRYSNQVTDTVKRAGYDSAFTVDGGGYKRRHPHLKISRVLVSKHLFAGGFNELLTSWGLFINKLFTRVLRIKDNLEIIFSS